MVRRGLRAYCLSLCPLALGNLACRTMLNSLIVTFLLVTFWSVDTKAEEVTAAHRVASVVFTTGLTKENQPENNLTKVSLDKERIYIFVRWKFDLEKQKSFIVSYRVFDGSGNYVNSMGRAFFPRTEDWNSWYRVYLRKNLNHTPGNWRFEVYLDDRKMVEKYLNVLPQKKRARWWKKKTQ